METLSKARKRKKITQKDIQALTGIPQKVISRLETGQSSPQKRILKRVESVLGRLNWLGTYGIPQPDRRRKKCSALDVELKLIRALESLHSLPKQDRYWSLIHLHRWIIEYVNAESEREEMTEVNHKLFRERFKENMSHKN